MSALPPKADIETQSRDAALCQKQTLARLLDMCAQAPIPLRNLLTDPALADVPWRDAADLN